MSPTPRVAVAGAGYFARYHLNAWRRLHQQARVELVALCDRERKTAAAAAARLGFDAVFSDAAEMLASTRPDLLDIVTPPPTHAGLVEAALAHQAAAICQKPFTPSLAEAEALVARIAAAGATVIVHENFRFQPWYGRIHALLRDGALGELYQLSFRLRPGDGQGAEAYLARQPYFQRMPRFLVHETAVHQIDVFRYLAGEVRSVYAQLDRRNPAIAGEDAGLIVFEFDRGVRGLFDGNRLADHPARNRRLTMGEMYLEGSAATLRLDGDGGLFLRAHGDNRETPVDYDWRDEDFGGDCVYRLQSQVVEHLAGRAPAVNTAQDYLLNLRVVEAIYRSAESGRKVAL